MKRCSECGGEKLLSDFHKDKRKKDGHREVCKVCACARARDNRVKRRAELKAYGSAYFTANKETIYARRRERLDPEKMTAYYDAYRAANRDHIRSQTKEYMQRNKDKMRVFMTASEARRRAAKIKATPPWADKNAIDAVYLLCAERTKQTGVKHHVDHIIPLRGRGVCGLHVHWNLQVLEATQNHRKSNLYSSALACANLPAASSCSASGAPTCDAR